MSIRLASRRIPNGRDAASIRKWAMVFMLVGIIGQGVIQNAFVAPDIIVFDGHTSRQYHANTMNRITGMVDHRPAGIASGKCLQAGHHRLHILRRNTAKQHRLR